MRHRSTRAFRNILLTTTALVAALAGGGRAASAGRAGEQRACGLPRGVGGRHAQHAHGQPSRSSLRARARRSSPGAPSGSPRARRCSSCSRASSSVALNRVTGGNVSSIMGSLLANGQVWIVNPAGVFFGPGAQVDVAGLDGDHGGHPEQRLPHRQLPVRHRLAEPEREHREPGPHQGGATAARRCWRARRSTNQGLIEAQLGTVVLGGAKTFAVDFQGDKLLSFQVTGAVDQRPQNADGTPASALVTNSGTITATGGTVLLTARAAKNVIDNVINSSGIVEATSAKSVNGEIILDGGDTGAVTVSGSLDASGKGTGETGGTVKVLGDQVSARRGRQHRRLRRRRRRHGAGGRQFPRAAAPRQNAATTTISAGSQDQRERDHEGQRRQGRGLVRHAHDLRRHDHGDRRLRGRQRRLCRDVGQSPRGPIDREGRYRRRRRAPPARWLLDPADFTIGTNAGEISPVAITLDAEQQRGRSSRRAATRTRATETSRSTPRAVAYLRERPRSVPAGSRRHPRQRADQEHALERQRRHQPDLRLGRFDRPHHRQQHRVQRRQSRRHADRASDRHRRAPRHARLLRRHGRDRQRRCDHARCQPRQRQQPDPSAGSDAAHDFSHHRHYQRHRYQHRR